MQFTVEISASKQKVWDTFGKTKPSAIGLA